MTLRKWRVMVWLLGIAVSCACVLLAGHPAVAQDAPQPPPLPPLPAPPGLDKLLADPGGWLTEMFNDAVLSLGQKTTGDVVGFMDWLMGTGNVISQTPAILSYANPSVINLWGIMRLAGNAGLAAVTAWGGINLMLSPHIREPYHGALELLPRVLLSGIMVNFSLSWGGFVVDLNNALCEVIGAAPMPGWGDLQNQPADGPVLLNLVAMGIYLILGLLLLGQMLMRLALVDALLVIAPLAVLCWVLPQTYSWARLWFSTFFGTVFVQAIQVLVLSLGANMILQLPSLLFTLGAKGSNGAQIWLTTLLLGMAVLQLARKVPRLMPGAVAGVGVAYTGPTIRQFSALFHSSKDHQKGRK